LGLTKCRRRSAWFPPTWVTSFVALILVAVFPVVVAVAPALFDFPRAARRSLPTPASPPASSSVLHRGVRGSIPDPLDFPRVYRVLEWSENEVLLRDRRFTTISVTAKVGFTINGFPVLGLVRSPDGVELRLRAGDRAVTVTIPYD